MNITKKLFLSFVGLTGLTLIATLLLARWSFEQGLTEFVNNLEQQRLAKMSETLEGLLLDAEGDWTKVPPILLEQAVNQGPSKRGPAGARRGGRPSPKYASDRPSGRLTGPPPSGPTNRPPPPPMRRDLPIYTVLYDQDGNLLVGNRAEHKPDINSDNAIINEVAVSLNGQDVGLLKSWNTHKFGSLSGGKFSQQQQMTSIWIGCIFILLAILVSFYLSKGLLTPLNRALAGIKSVSKGRYDKPIEHQRKDEFGTLMDNINALAFKLEKSKTAKNRWFADISHELRTPLSVLLGEIEAILVGIRPANEKNLKSLEQEALVLKRLIEDLYQLSISDIGALRYEFKPFNLSDLTERLCESAQRPSKEVGISLSCNIEKPLVIEGDESRLSQLISNLINNSLKYTDAGGTSKMTLKQVENEIIFSIDDSAPCVSTDMLSQMFDPLIREEKSRSRDKGGAGLGLAICKNIVEAHSGVISASASSQGGVHICVRLPLSKTAG